METQILQTQRLEDETPDEKAVAMLYLLTIQLQP